MELPNITPAQVQADIVSVSGILATVGLKLDGDLQTNLAAAIIGALAFAGAVHKIADAIIRNGRAGIIEAAVMAPGDTKVELEKVRKA